jgi:ABC-type uncharacterized transport system ATPase subunit
MTAIGAAPPPALALRGVSKSFGSVLVNDQVSLAVAAGAILALVGENGAGKTTAMRIASGFYAPDRGTVEVRGEEQRFAGPQDATRRGIGMVHQHFLLVEAMTVTENVVLGAEPGRPWAIDRAGAAARVAALSRDLGLEVDPAARVSGLSVGERQRVELLKVLYRRADVVILDEPTAVLTPAEASRLFAVLARLRAENRAVVLITHKLPEALDLADEVTVLRAGRVVATMAAADTNAAALARLMVGRAGMAAVLAPVLSPPAVPAAASAAASASSKAPSTPHAPVVDRTSTPAPTAQSAPEEALAPAPALASALDLVDSAPRGTPGAAGDAAPSSPATASRRVVPCGAPVLVVERLTVLGAGGRRRVDGVSFTVHAGEILGIAGVEGNGQSELVEALAGLAEPGAVGGTARLGGIDLAGASVRRRRALGLAHVPEDRQRRGLALDLSVAENAVLGVEDRPPFAVGPRRLWLDRAAIARRAAAIVERFAVRPARLDLPARALSGGNQQRLVVGREIAALALPEAGPSPAPRRPTPGALSRPPSPSPSAGAPPPSSSQPATPEPPLASPGQRATPEPPLASPGQPATPEPPLASPGQPAAAKPPARLLLAAHPTRGLDLAGSRLVRDELLALRDGGCAVLLVSADLDEVLALAGRILVLYRGRVAGEINAAAASPEDLGVLMTGGSAAAATA